MIYEADKKTVGKFRGVKKLTKLAATAYRMKMFAAFNQKHVGLVDVGYFPLPGGLKVTYYITNYKNYKITSLPASSTIQIVNNAPTALS